MILLLGASGYLGSEFARYFARHQIPFLGVSRSSVDYTQRDRLIQLIEQSKASFLINAAGYTGKPNVDACEVHKAECLAGNAVLPATIREATEHTQLSWGHISSGCIYEGARSGGNGFTEDDPPNFCFRSNHCSFYSGCKALGEECLEGAENVYVWRVRIPFDNQPGPRNYLSKLQNYQRLLDATNSISHLGEFVHAAWQCWEKRVPTGIYNVTNTGAVTTREVVAMIKQTLGLEKEFDFFDDEEEFMQKAAIAPRSNCILDNSKLLATGIELSHVQDAVQQSLTQWQDPSVVPPDPR